MDSAFVSGSRTARTATRGDDLDRAGLCILEGRLGGAYPDMAWEPKAAFAAVAQRNRR